MKPRALPWIGPLLALSLASCGDDEFPTTERPGPDAVRAYYGLGGGSCLRYRYSSGGNTLFARVDVKGPDEQRVAGETVYVWEFRETEAGGFPDEWLLIPGEGELRLVRSTFGATQQERVTYRYEDADRPLFAQLELDDGEIIFEPGPFETLTTPERCPVQDEACTTPEAPFSHVWTVLDDQGMAVTPTGTSTAVELNYEVEREGVAESWRYSLVPNFGFARMISPDGITYQVCAARICDGAGTCTGAPSCDELTCN